MAKIHGGSGVPQGSLTKGTAPKPSPIHHGSGKPVGVLAPKRRPVINAANYAAQKVKRT